MTVPGVRGPRRLLVTTVAVAALVLTGVGGGVWLGIRPDRAATTGAAGTPSSFVTAAPDPTGTAPSGTASSGTAPSSAGAVSRGAETAAPGRSGAAETGASGDHGPDSGGHADAGHAFIDPAAAVPHRTAPTPTAPVTCGDWRRLRSADVRTRSATVLLRAARSNGGTTAKPPRSLAAAYGRALGAACGGAKAGVAVADVAREIFDRDPERWGP